MIDMERKIGEIFEYNGEWYQCVKGNTCDECSFNKSSWNCLFDGTPYCSDRSDEIEVIFKKLEKVGEPFAYTFTTDKIYNVLMQQYKVYYDEIIPFVIDHFFINNLQTNTIAIEIKQTKEDMKETKLNIKPFSLEAAKAGKPICTRDGRKARIICFDRKFYHEGYNYPIVAMINDNDNEFVYAYTQDGLLVGNDERESDLMMLPEKKEGWVNVYKDSVYDTKDEALNRISEYRGYIDTIKINWSE